MTRKVGIMNEKLVRVKTYYLQTTDIEIEFSMKDPDELQLVYRCKEAKREFSGRAIYREETQLGFMVSVILENEPDSPSTTLSLAIPIVNKPNDVRSIKVKTFAVLTTTRISKSGSEEINGQIQTYEILTMEGNAW